MGIDSEIPPGQSSDDSGPLTLDMHTLCMCVRRQSVLVVVWVCRACWISSYTNNPSYTEDDEYHIAKECSHGWRSIRSDE